MNLTDIKKRFPKKQTIFSIVSFSVNTGKPMPEILKEEYPHFFEFTDRILEIEKVYTSYKKKNNLLDYDDLLVCLNKFLNDQNTTSKSFLSTIKYVMIDEYQDTNKLQAEIVKGLSRYNNNVMVVGDDSQIDFSFRGANFKNIMYFPNQFSGTTIKNSNENYEAHRNSNTEQCY